MEYIFLISIIILIVWFLLIEYLQAKFYGTYVKDKDFLSVLTEQLKNGGTTKNRNTDSIQIGTYRRLVKYPAFPMLCKYYIEGIGMVPRWSKTHKLIRSACR